MYEAEKCLRTVEILKGGTFTAGEAAQIFNELSGKAQTNTRSVIRLLRAYATIEIVTRTKEGQIYRIQGA